MRAFNNLQVMKHCATHDVYYRQALARWMDRIRERITYWQRRWNGDLGAKWKLREDAPVLEPALGAISRAPRRTGVPA